MQIVYHDLCVKASPPRHQHLWCFLLYSVSVPLTCVPTHALRASDRYLQEKRKIITGDDILFAMATLRFDNHIDPLRIYLQKY